MAFTVKIICGHCSDRADVPIFAVATIRRKIPEIAPPGQLVRRINRDSPGQDRDNEAVAVGICPHCGGPIMFSFKCSTDKLRGIDEILKSPSKIMVGQDTGMGGLRSYPPPPEPISNPHWPAKLARAFRDAQRAGDNSESPAIAIRECRLVMEKAVEALGFKKGSMRTRIDRLLEKRLITHDLAEWANHLWKEGNAAVHEDEGSPDDARELVAFTRMFLDMVFTIPATIRERKLKQE